MGLRSTSRESRQLECSLLTAQCKFDIEVRVGLCRPGNYVEYGIELCVGPIRRLNETRAVFAEPSRANKLLDIILFVYFALSIGLLKWPPLSARQTLNLWCNSVIQSQL